MVKLVYYILIKPLSYLPLRLLYLLSDFFYFLVYFVIGYRKEVVANNINNSFPDLSSEERRSITKKFYRHFCDLMIESLRLFSMPKTEILKRLKVKNPELLNHYFEANRNIILVSGHYNNWEILAVGLNAQIKHRIVGIYTPLTNPFFEKKFSESRTKLGTILVSKYDVKKYFGDEQKEPVAIIFGSDQSPQFIRDNTYWTTFLNQETAVLYGSEKYAKEFDYPVIFMAISKLKRGHYELEFTPIEEKPVDSAYCSITERHTQMLEKQITQAPEFYLWTHKRWKHSKPQPQS